MSIVSAAAGQTITASTQFLDENDDPVEDIIDPVTYKIYSPTRKLVYQSTGTRDGVDPSLYTATFTLPTSAPSTAQGERYRIQWNATDRIGCKYSESELFELTNAGDAPDDEQDEPSVIVYTGAPTTDFLKIYNVSPQPTVTYQMIDETGKVIASATPSAPNIVGKFAIYSVQFAANSIPLPTGVQQHYMGNWILSGGLTQQTEVESHPVYMMTPVVQTIAHALRHMFRKGILSNIEPFTTLSAGDYVHHITKGFEYINGLPPRVTAFTIAGPLPTGMTHYIEVAAAISMLREMLFAYQNDWDFQGLGTQLNVNRAQTIQSMLSELETDLQQATQAKNNWLMSGSPTATAGAGAAAKMPLSVTKITLGPETNFAAPNIPFDGIVSSYLLLGGRIGVGGGRRL
jgi:hypothetical protein